MPPCEARAGCPVRPPWLAKLCRRAAAEEAGPSPGPSQLSSNSTGGPLKKPLKKIIIYEKECY